MISDGVIACGILAPCKIPDPDGRATAHSMTQSTIPLAWRNLTENQAPLADFGGRDGVRRDADVHGERLSQRAARQHGGPDPAFRRPVGHRQPDGLHALGARTRSRTAGSNRRGRSRKWSRASRSRSRRGDRSGGTRRRAVAADPRGRLPASRRCARSRRGRSSARGLEPSDTAMADALSRTERLGPARRRDGLRAVGEDGPHRGDVRPRRPTSRATGPWS